MVGDAARRARLARLRTGSTSTGTPATDESSCPSSATHSTVVVARGDLSIGEGDQGRELRYGPLRFPLAKGTEHLDVAEAVDRQHYRLQWWRDPARNVRRFFTIDDLVAVRAEQLAVAEVIDTIPARLAPHPAFAGVRVDHVDGLAHPEAYLHGLRDRIGPHRWLLVEKILAVGESLPASWPVDGTTGYEHIRVTEHALLDPSAEQPLTELWHDLTGDVRGFEQIEDEGRREAIAGGLRPDLDRLVRLRSRCPAMPTSIGFDAAVVELTIGVHRYRTYLPDDAASVAELQAAFERASTRRPDLVDELTVLVDEIRRRPAIATRWEQLCSPVMAKGAEDRAFYRYLRLASLCEVGGAPGQWSLTDRCLSPSISVDVQQHAPVAMLAGTTHDTKRSEGVRARSLALAEVADDWAAAVRSWFGEHRELVEGVDAATVSLALQTAVTAWPIDADRLTEYLVKSAREADLTHVVDRHRRGLRIGARPTGDGADRRVVGRTGRRRFGRRRRTCAPRDHRRTLPAGLGAVVGSARDPAHVAGRGRPLPGHGGLHLLAGRSRQSHRTRLGPSDEPWSNRRSTRWTDVVGTRRRRRLEGSGDHPHPGAATAPTRGVRGDRRDTSRWRSPAPTRIERWPLLGPTVIGPPS